MHDSVLCRKFTSFSEFRRSRSIQETSDPCLSGFRVLANFHRMFGACFLKDMQKLDILQDNSWAYLIYHIVLWLLFGGIAYLVSSIFQEVVITCAHKTIFNLSLWFVLIWSTSVEAFLNSRLMRTQAENWLKVLSKCRLIERDIRATRSMARRMKVSAYGILGLQCLVIGFNLIINCLNDFGLGITTMGGDEFKFSITQRIYALTCSVVNGFQIPANSTITRVWMIYFCRLFSVYLRHIHEKLKFILEDPQNTVEQKTEICDKMRVALNQVREVSASVSDIIGLAILYGYGHSIPLLCLASYFVALNGVSFQVRLYFITFGIAHMLSILIPTILSSIVLKEIRSLRHTLENIPCSNAGPALANHLTLLQRVVNEADFSVQANGFFQVDLPMFTSVTGAVVVYTVMLVQMRNQLFEKIIAPLNLTDFSNRTSRA